MVRLTAHESPSRETARRECAQALASEDVVRAEIDGEYVACVADVRDLRAAPPDPQRPVVCFL
jgi:hypothetical protein